MREKIIERAGKRGKGRDKEDVRKTLDREKARESVRVR